ncbi:MAG: hypothetical protein ACYS8Z_20715 [Planctomycetota bacterium]|jgi:hypothetical protein
MEENLEFSAQEQVLAEQYLAKLERQARNHDRNRWVLIFVAGSSLLFGSHCMIHFLRDIYSDHSIADYLKKADAVPPGYLPEYWFVAELRRTALVFEEFHSRHSLALLDGLIGVICITGGALGLAFLLMRWKDGARYALLAKILRAKWNSLLVKDNSEPTPPDLPTHNEEAR